VARAGLRERVHQRGLVESNLLLSLLLLSLLLLLLKLLSRLLLLSEVAIRWPCRAPSTAADAAGSGFDRGGGVVFTSSGAGGTHGGGFGGWGVNLWAVCRGRADDGSVGAPGRRVGLGHKPTLSAPAKILSIFRYSTQRRRNNVGILY
jgi:hypothetical protein